MEANVRLGRIWGIPIGLSYSWFLVFGLVTWSLAAGYFSLEFPALPEVGLWSLAVVTSVLFFGSVLLHELGHTLIALRNGIPVRAINLFIFGGVAQITREPATPGVEFRVAIAGPAVSLVLALLFAALLVAGGEDSYLAAPSLWLMRINFSLAIFNLLPGFPLDGGRVLRAIVWRLTGSYHQATRVATGMGQVTALGFIVFGVFSLVGGSFIQGLWMVFIGWFLQNAASAAQAQSKIQQTLAGVRVGQVMAPGCVPVSGGLSLRRLVDERLLATGQRCFFVADRGQLQGVLTLQDITAVPRGQWDEMTTEKAMVPLEQLVRVDPNTELLAALRMMDEAGVAQMPVVEGGQIVGIISREHVLHHLRLRSELQV